MVYISKVMRLPLAWLVCAGLLAGQTPAAVDLQTLGPQVGAHVPAFALQDQNGHSRTLDSVMGPKGAILVFFRSADW